VATQLRRFVRSEWRAAILVCAKCSKRVGGGFGDKGRTRLAKALRRHLGIRRGRKAPIGVVEVRCLGVCPRAQITVVNSSVPHRWRLVSPGDDLGELTRDLGLDDTSALAADAGDR